MTLVIDYFTDSVCAELMLVRDPAQVLIAAAKHLKGRDEMPTGPASEARATLLDLACRIIVDRALTSEKAAAVSSSLARGAR